MVSTKFCEFRPAHKATSNSPHFERKTYVVKYFLPATVEIIKTQIGETKLDHAKKCVQMHSLHRPVFYQIAAKVQKEGNNMAKCSDIIGLKKYLHCT